MFRAKAANVVSVNSGFISPSTTAANAVLQLLAEAVSDVPVPMILDIGSDTPSSVANNGPISASGRYGASGMLLSAGTAITPDNLGTFVGIQLSYGTEAAKKRTFFDARQGAYQLPPCTFAKATLFAWHPSAGAVSISARFAGALSEGVKHMPSIPVATVGVSQLAAAGSVTATPPNGTVAIELASVTSTAQLQCTTDSKGELILRNYVTQTFVPPYGPVYVNNAWQGVTITNNGAAAADALLKAFVDL